MFLCGAPYSAACLGSLAALARLPVALLFRRAGRINPPLCQTVKNAEKLNEINGHGGEGGRHFYVVFGFDVSHLMT